ncbi:MAG: single-stranded-DNA-specific exonuclease RecJ [Sphingobacteriales bacterium JAD_PAG50586_3]|nr:MAG: single-stranded-DNA-specific exonuclease RecJ [Sphingobacteriales bacterium JAD_PAG50586_3]
MVLNKRWVINKVDDVETVEKLSKELNINKTLARLLVSRGVSTFDEAKKFFRPDASHLHNPFLMADMDKAVNRLLDAIETGEKILIYGDYDVDGTTSVALVYSFLKNYYPHLAYYIPDRYKEGYGISFDGVDYANTNGYSLIIALDCGIKSIDKVEYATQRGIDFIICDHHLPGDELPKAVAVLDPKRADCNYPFDELSGCGIGFKLMQGYCIKAGVDLEQLYKYIDLVAVSIAADIVPIVGENRTLACMGLNKLNTNPLPGLKAIIEFNKLNRDLSISDVVFIIGPRINAAGRIESGSRAVDLLISDHADSTVLPSADINDNNTTRRDLDRSITQSALDMIASDNIYTNRRSTVLYRPDWHKGVIGIVASRLIENYYRPTIVLTKSGEHVAGSARSVKGFDVYEAILACSDLLIQFGGHKFAAGLTMEEANVEAFIQRFEEVVAATITEESLTPEVEVDAEIDLSEITPKFYDILKQFAPFGPGNMNPVFLTRGVRDRGYGRVVGSTHLKLDLQQDNPNLFFNAIAFGQGHYVESIAKKIPFDVCYSIEPNEWNGKVTLQLNIKDMAF